MPKKNFVNFGDLQGFEYLKGTIVSIGDEDLCTVTVNGADYESVPIYYHCTPEAEERENGAIEGGSTGFAEDDEVIVLKQRPDLDDKIFVIGHLEGARHCCWIEPFDGPELTTKWEWKPEYIYFHEFDEDGVPDYPELSPFEFSVEDGAIVITKEPDVEPEEGWASVIPGSWGEDDYHQFGITYPTNPSTTGTWNNPSININATKVQVSIKEMLFICCRWPNVVARSMFSVVIYGLKAGTAEKCVFSIYFMSEAALGDYFNASTSEIYAQGQWCLADDLVEHSYQEEFVLGGDASVNDYEGDASLYYAYIPVSVPLWLSFPFPIDVRAVQVFIQLSQKGMYTDWSRREEMPGITVKIDKIEIC